MDNKILFGILTLLFNAIGVPCFMVGNAKAGIIRIVLWLVTCGIFGVINGIMGLIQGIKILCMSDEDFAAADKVTLLSGIPSGKPKADAE